MNFSIDLIILIGGLFFFMIGFNKGFWRTLIGPLALILGAGAGFLHYQKTGEWMTAFLISVLGPFFIKLGFGLALWFFPKKKEEKDEPVTLGKLSGGALNALWGCGMMALVLMFLTLIPGRWAWLNALQTSVTESRTYRWINAWSGRLFQNGQDELRGVMTFWDKPENLAAVEATPEYREIMAEDKVQAILEDENLLQKIREQNLLEALRDPRIQDLIRDKTLVEKFIALQKQMINAAGNGKSSAPSPAGPRVINVTP